MIIWEVAAETQKNLTYNKAMGFTDISHICVITLYTHLVVVIPMMHVLHPEHSRLTGSVFSSFHYSTGVNVPLMQIHFLCSNPQELGLKLA